ncbi:MAG TPA: EAL domain-containing protein, partial [Burkholderiales bacterium]
LGYARSEMPGLNGRDTYLDDEREMHTRRMREVDAGATLRFERMVRRKDGTAFPAEISVKKLDNGLVQVIFHDISERRRTQQALASERALLRTLVDALPDVVFTKDTDGRFTMANLAAYHHCAQPDEASMLGKTVEDFYPPELARQYREDDERALQGGTILNREEPGIDAAGRRRWYLTIKAPLRDALGRISGMVAISRDITERKQQEDRIARLARIQAVLSGINSAIVRIRNREELFRETCRIATEAGAFRIAIIGMKDERGLVVPVAWGGAGGELIAAVPKDTQGDPSGVVARAIRERAPAVENDILLRPDIDVLRIEAIRLGCRAAIALPLHGDGEPFGMIVLYSTEKNAFDADEITLLEELADDVSFALTFIAQQEKVSYLAYYDTLTGLPNRSLFFDRLGQQLAAAGRERGKVALVSLNVDRFRMVNETLGRNAGDALLKAIAERIKDSQREQDTVARTSADGFAIVASAAWRTPDLAHLIEARNRELFSAPFWIEGEELRVSATAGVAVFPDDADTAEALVANAEAALRSAKQHSVPLLFYGREMNAQAAESLRMENRLRKALEKHELALWYQPKIDSRTGRFTGFEALMRWIDPESGPVPPAHFIPILEKTGLIMEAGTWALQQVARDCETWMKGSRAAPRIAVNVSPLQLRDKHFVDSVVDAAGKIDAAGGILDLEITESVIMEDVDAVILKLQTVRGLGVRIYIDDFGTGYSSLAYIARLPIHALKIDRSFVVDMTQNGDSLNIVQSVISLAHSLKLRVVAEGVETEAQAELLKRLDCDELQGYLYGKPTPPAELRGVLGGEAVSGERTEGP